MKTTDPVGETRPPCETAPQAPPDAPPEHPAVPAGTAPTENPPAGGATAPTSENIPQGGATRPPWQPPGTPLPATGPGAAAAYAPPQPKKESQPFTATKADLLLLLAALALGFLFVRWIMWNGFAGWGVTVFTALYAAVVLAYARAKGVTPARASWFWLAVLLVCGASYALWPPGLLAFPKALLLFGSAVYWCGSLFGILLLKKTGNLLPLDAINLLLLIPFGNMGTLGKSLAVLPARGEGKKTLKSGVVPVLVGLALCVPLLALVVPQLAAADSGNFSHLVRSVTDYFRDFWLWRLFQEELGTLVMQALLGLPVALWLYGYLAGGAHKRNTGVIDAREAQKTMTAFRLVPHVTVLIVLFVASAVYLVFIACQLPYFFSAFAGAKPAGYNVYSEYAREGFFELCSIAAVNLVLLGLAGVFCRPAGEKKTGLRIANLALCVLTLLIIATAFSKMGLYVVRQGFTPRRIMTCVFMVFLAGVFVAVMAHQFRKFSIVRFGAVYGAALLCALCVCNLDAMVTRYNAAQYRAGNLPVFDELVLARGGPAGAPAAQEIYTQLGDEADPAQKLRLSWALFLLREDALATEGTPRDNLAHARARQIHLPMADERPAGMDDEAWQRLQKSKADGTFQWREWQYRQMEAASQAFEEYYADALARGGYD